jgi:hypothetical protein
MAGKIKVLSGSEYGGKNHQPDIMCRDFYEHCSDKEREAHQMVSNRNIIIVPTIWCVPSTYLLRALQEKVLDSELLSRRLFLPALFSQCHDS